MAVEVELVSELPVLILLSHILVPNPFLLHLIPVVVYLCVQDGINQFREVEGEL